MQWWHIMLIVLAVVAAVMAGLYFYGKKLQKRQNEAQAQIDAMKQVASILVIDKKMLKMKESGLPQAAIDQTPKLMRNSKVPIVKAKVGPRVMILAADKDVFEILPVKKEVKVEISGMYITGIKSVRGGSVELTKKQLKEKEKAEKQAAREARKASKG